MIDRMQAAMHDTEHYLYKDFRSILPSNSAYYANFINKWGVFDFKSLEKTMSRESYSGKDVPYHWALIQIACETESYRQGSNGIRQNFLKMVLNQEFNHNYRDVKLNLLHKVYEAYAPFKHIHTEYPDAQALSDFIVSSKLSPNDWTTLLKFVDKTDYRDLYSHCHKVYEKEYARQSAEQLKTFAKTAMIYPPITDYLAQGKTSRKQDFQSKLYQWEFNETQAQYLIALFSQDNRVSHESVENKIARALWMGVEAKPQDKLDFLLNSGQMRYTMVSLAESLRESSRTLFYGHLLETLSEQNRLPDKGLFEVLDRLPRITDNGETLDFFEYAMKNSDSLRYSDSLLFRYLDRGMDGDLKNRTLLAKDWEECRRVDKLLNGEAGFFAGLFASFRGNPQTDLEFAAFKAYMKQDTDSFYAYIGQFGKERGWEYPMAMDHVQLGVLMSYCETKNPDWVAYNQTLLKGLQERSLLGAVSGLGKHSAWGYGQIRDYPEKREVMENLDNYLYFGEDKSLSVKLKQGTVSLINKM